MIVDKTHLEQASEEPGSHSADSSVDIQEGVPDEHRKQVSTGPLAPKACDDRLKSADFLLSDSRPCLL